jgi:hypothetical protein
LQGLELSLKHENIPTKELQGLGRPLEDENGKEFGEAHPPQSARMSLENFQGYQPY